ncbi:Vacuolar protein sorting-associated protein 4, partial [Coemansia spiralis]
MSGANFLTNAIDIIKKAIAEDTAGNYEEAYGHYKNGIEWFLTAIKYEKNDRQREKLRQKLVEYIDRAEQLKDHVKAQKGQKPVAVGGNGGGAKKKANGAGKGGDDGDGGLDSETRKLRQGLEGAILSEKPN